MTETPLGEAISLGDSLQDRRIRWSQLFTRAVIRSPEFRASLPGDFHLILVPKGDPEVAAHNRALAARRGYDESNAVVCEIELVEDERVNLYPHVPQPRPILGLSV